MPAQSSLDEVYRLQFPRILSVLIRLTGNRAQAEELASEALYRLSSRPKPRVTVMSRHSDPRTGERVFRLTNIRLGDPDRALFQLPPGYSVITQ